MGRDIRFGLLGGCSVSISQKRGPTRAPIEIAADLSRRREMPIETSTSHETFRAASSL